MSLNIVENLKIHKREIRNIHKKLKIIKKNK